MSKRVFVVGVGMTKFVKPPSKKDYDEFGSEAVKLALKDANLPYELVESAVCGYCYGDSTCGQRVLYHVGMTGIPIVNVNNNCSTGSSSIYFARTLIQSGKRCVLAVGFEKMEPGNLTQKYEATHATPTGKHFENMYAMGADKTKLGSSTNQFTEDVIKLFAEAQKEHMTKYGSKIEDYVQIAYKNHRQSVYNPYAVLNKEIPYESILKSPVVYGPMLRALSCPMACGASCAILCDEQFVKEHKLWEKAVEIVAQAMVSDNKRSFNNGFMNLSGYGMAKEAASQAFMQANITPMDIDVIECHNCFSCNELFMYEALGLCEEGEGGKLIQNGKWKKNSNGGELYHLYALSPNKKSKNWVVNPSGGLECKGHPIGATGVAQCCELVWQLRNEAKKRQVDNAKVALQHNIGLGSSVVVTIYRKPILRSML